jgi:Mg-chelatase subunit ChlD
MHLLVTDILLPFQSSASSGSDKLKLETIASCKSIPWAESRTGFPVLVRVTAPLERTHRLSVDLVAVLDTSGSMGAPGRLDSVKQAMGFVIDNLGDDDRLSIVPFRRTGNDHLRYPLSEMSEENRTKLKTVVNRLQPGGGDDLESANEAAKVSNTCLMHVML